MEKYKNIKNYNIDITELKQQINLILSNFEKKEDLKPDVKTLNTNGFNENDFNDMTNLKNFIILLISSYIDLENDVKTLLTSTYDSDDYENMTNLNNYLSSLLSTYQLISNLKNDVKTLLTSEFLQSDFEDMTNLINFINSLLKNSVMDLLTTGFLQSDYSNFTGFNNYLIKYSPIPVYMRFGGSTDAESQYMRNIVNLSIQTTFFTNCYKVVYCLFVKSPNQNHFDNLYLFRTASTNLTSGTLSTYFNCIPSTSLTTVPIIFTIGNVNDAISSTFTVYLYFGCKRLKVSMGNATNENNFHYVLRIKSTYPDMLNFDNLIGFNTTSNITQLPRIDDLTTSSGKLNEGILIDSSKAYFEYDYINKSTYSVKTAYKMQDMTY